MWQKLNNKGLGFCLVTPREAVGLSYASLGCPYLEHICPRYSKETSTLVDSGASLTIINASSVETNSACRGQLVEAHVYDGSRDVPNKWPCVTITCLSNSVPVQALVIRGVCYELLLPRSAISGLHHSIYWTGKQKQKKSAKVSVRLQLHHRRYCGSHCQEKKLRYFTWNYYTWEDISRKLQSSRYLLS